MPGYPKSDPKKTENAKLPPFLNPYWFCEKKTRWQLYSVRECRRPHEKIFSFADFLSKKRVFYDFRDLGVPWSSAGPVIQANYEVQTKMWYFLERRELVLKDGSGFTAIAAAKFAQWAKMRNFSTIFGDFSNT